MGDLTTFLAALVVWGYEHWPFLLLTLAIGVVQWLFEPKRATSSQFERGIASRGRVGAGITRTDGVRDEVADEPVDEDALAALRSLGFSKAAALLALRSTCSGRDSTTPDRVLRVLRGDPDGRQGPTSRP